MKIRTGKNIRTFIIIFMAFLLIAVILLQPWRELSFIAAGGTMDAVLSAAIPAILLAAAVMAGLFVQNLRYRRSLGEVRDILLRECGFSVQNAVMPQCRELAQSAACVMEVYADAARRAAELSSRLETVLGTVTGGNEGAMDQARRQTLSVINITSSIEKIALYDVLTNANEIQENFKLQLKILKSLGSVIAGLKEFPGMLIRLFDKNY